MEFTLKKKRLLLGLCVINPPGVFSECSVILGANPLSDVYKTSPAEEIQKSKPNYIVNKVQVSNKQHLFIISVTLK